MRIVGVVVIDRYPLQLCVEVAFHLADQLANVVAKIEAIGILGRNDESPHQFVALLPSFDSGKHVDVFALRVEGQSLRNFLLSAPVATGSRA